MNGMRSQFFSILRYRTLVWNSRNVQIHFSTLFPLLQHTSGTSFRFIIQLPVNFRCQFNKQQFLIREGTLAYSEAFLQVSQRALSLDLECNYVGATQELNIIRDAFTVLCSRNDKNNCMYNSMYNNCMHHVNPYREISDGLGEPLKNGRNAFLEGIPKKIGKHKTDHWLNIIQKQSYN